MHVDDDRDGCVLGYKSKDILKPKDMNKVGTEMLHHIQTFSQNDGVCMLGA